MSRKIIDKVYLKMPISMRISYHLYIKYKTNKIVRENVRKLVIEYLEKV